MSVVPLPATFETKRLKHKWRCRSLVRPATACKVHAWRLSGFTPNPGPPETVKGILYFLRNCHILVEFCNGLHQMSKQERELAGVLSLLDRCRYGP